MLEGLKAFEHKRPEIIFSWKDSETEAEGWVVINSLRGGAAGGGTRMRKGLDVNEVISLAKTMEIKFSIAGPGIGGAKSGINFDPTDPRKKGVLQRWYQAVLPLLKSYYGTGGDLNVDELHEVIPITSALGLMHPQEGIVNGHISTEGELKALCLANLRKGVSLPVYAADLVPETSGKYTVADMITGYGVAEAVRHYYDIRGISYLGKRATIQGFGNVGSAAAWYLAKMGISVVGILDRTGGVFNPTGFSAETIGQMIANRDGNALQVEGMIPYEEAQTRFWNLEAEIFTPNAGSRMVTMENVQQMKAAGIEVISCGANVPFADPEIFLGATGIQADAQFALLPDFIANCGMARVFAYLMQVDAVVEERAIFDDVSSIIHGALQRVLSAHTADTCITETAFSVSLDILHSPIHQKA